GLANLRHMGFGVVLDDFGQVIQASPSRLYNQVSKRMAVYNVKPGCVVLPLLQVRDRGREDETKVFDGRSNGLLNQEKTFAKTCDGIVFWYAEDRIKAIKAFYTDTIAMLGSGEAELKTVSEKQKKTETDKQRAARTLGTGIPIGDEFRLPNSTQQCAADMWRLNEFRITSLRDRGVKDSSLSELHGRAEDLLLEAQNSKKLLEKEAKASASFHLERSVYRQVRSMFDDLVFAVLILLALCIPFAFAMERLLIGSTSIYKQILWFVVFFVLTFILLYFTHPAFAISNAPLIIFLGFAILVLSSLVIWIILQKFEVELKVLQGMESTVHAADISRVNTIIAAMNMGISSMRRRPLRTTLSAVTIILLTFTILCFASFGTQMGVITLFSQPAPDYFGVFVRDFNWNELSDGLLTEIEGRWGKKIPIFKRYWICPGQDRGPGATSGILLTRADATEPLVMKGILGIDPGELAFRPKIANIIQLPKGVDAKQAFDQYIWLPSSTATFLNVKPGDKVMLNGETLTVAPFIDEVRLSVLRDMDDSSLLPVDFEEDTSVNQTTDLSDPTQLQQKTWKTIGVDSCAIVSNTVARKMGARLRAILLYTRDSLEAGTIASEIARIFPSPVPATLSDGVYLHVLGAKLSASGVKDLFFPILLGGLVIFGTMLGSVADREKEVYTFSALGLAPGHVAGLFFAEAMVYSVIGGMSGYLLAQAMMKILDFLAQYGLVQVPEMNYSSTNAIVTILLVMVTVLISALYPAYKASKSANPGVMRSWKLPPPKGNILDLVFPFTVSQYDITGVVSFLREHFDTYSDTGLGTFMASDTALGKDEEGRLVLRCKLALAPFDLGVTETFEMTSVPSEIPGIDEVAIKLERLSGQPKDWYRLNKVLLNDLRKQFLIWRSLPAATMEIYRERTLVELGERVQHAEQQQEAGQQQDETLSNNLSQGSEA
ncbi:MAG: FtsX-like permease family protein, partial [Lentisphaerae bacterium]